MACYYEQNSFFPIICKLNGSMLGMNVILVDTFLIKSQAQSALMKYLNLSFLCDPVKLARKC